MAIASLVLLTGCGGSSGGDEGASSAGQLSPAATLGEKIFHDASLSASGRQACASCHDPARGHAPANSLAVQMGGPLLERQGARSAPSIRYLAANTAFFFDAEGTPTGGFFWDGRATSLQDQAARPFLDAREMANNSKAEVVGRLSRAAYAEEFKALFGVAILDDAEGAFERITFALQRYQQEDADFHAYSSRYDDFLRGGAALSGQELRGLALFNAPGKGNCAACHPSARGTDGSMPLFTDFSYDNLGVPRNPEIAANGDPAHYDLGLCAREGGDLTLRRDLCGAFKVPSLRNVARRGAFFHNGRFKTLEEALTFYVQRDTDSAKWYPLAGDGSVARFDDLPASMHANVNTTEAPYNRRAGDVPALSDAEIDDVIAFLQTLDDRDAP